LFVIAHPHNGQAPTPGNGTMVAFLAATRAMVRQAHDVALQHGGTSEGQPGLRPEYHAHYYGVYFRDPDGNKLCVACHEPE
jgi:lactoylglutathione lyase